MGIYSDEEYGTHNANDESYRRKLDNRFKVFAHGASSVECVHSNINPELIKCEVCGESNINFVFILKNGSSDTIKCGYRCATQQRVVKIDKLPQWKKHLEEQIKKEDERVQELRSQRKRIVRKKAN